MQPPTLNSFFFQIGSRTRYSQIESTWTLCQTIEVILFVCFVSPFACPHLLIFASQSLLDRFCYVGMSSMQMEAFTSNLVSTFSLIGPSWNFWMSVNLWLIHCVHVSYLLSSLNVMSSLFICAVGFFFFNVSYFVCDLQTGQHVTQLQHIMPDEYINAMMTMLDKVKNFLLTPVCLCCKHFLIFLFLICAFVILFFKPYWAVCWLFRCFFFFSPSTVRFLFTLSFFCSSVLQTWSLSFYLDFHFEFALLSRFPFCLFPRVWT